MEGTSTHSFNICPKAPHGSPIQCCNMRRRIGEHQIILEEQTSLEEGRSAKPGPGSQIGAVGCCEVEGKAIHSFNICPKAPHGSPIQCCNMRRRIGEHQIILEEQTSLEEGRSAKPGPGRQIRAVGRHEGEGKAIHSFNVCPKAPHGSQIQGCNMRRRIGEHQIILEEQTSFEERVEMPNQAQAAKSELLVAVKWRERPSIPPIYAQRLLMGPKHKVATCVEELGSTKSYWRSKRLSKRGSKCQTRPRQPNRSCWWP